MAAKKARSRKVLPRTHTFFKTLPRELRDIIYDELFQEVGYNDQKSYIQIRAPLMTLRLVSRQFKAEYEDRFLQNEHLSRLGINHGIQFGNVFNPPLVRCPPLATYTTSMTLNLYACHFYHPHPPHASATCDLRANLRENRDWINEFVACLPHLRSIHVNLLIFTDECRHIALRSLGLLADIPQIVEIKLRPAYSIAVEDMDDFPTLAIWTRQHGVVEDEEAREQCLQRKVFFPQ